MHAMDCHELANNFSEHSNEKRIRELCVLFSRNPYTTAVHSTNCIQNIRFTMTHIVYLILLHIYINVHRYKFLLFMNFGANGKHANKSFYCLLAML